MRGEYFGDLVARNVAVGSPPHARGIHLSTWENARQNLVLGTTSSCFTQRYHIHRYQIFVTQLPSPTFHTSHDRILKYD